MRIWHLPIEPITDRYSEQWARWFPSRMMAGGHTCFTLGGYSFTDGIEQGEFLDVLGTNHYKATQLALFTQQLHGGGVRDGDWVFLADAWSPQVISLAYMRDLGRVKFKIAGCLHAGSWDAWDLLGQTFAVGAVWGPPFERALMEALDVVFVATQSHRDMIYSRDLIPQSDRVIVTGFPLYAEEWAEHALEWEHRPKRVVFPHRLAREKAPEVFDDLRSTYQQLYPYDEVEWVRTRDVCSTKDEYYEVLGGARVAFSSALQETWGIAMLEAASLGCHPVVPDRLSYRELYEPEYRYRSVAQAARIVHTALQVPYPYNLDLCPGYEAIGKMLTVMEARS